MIKTRLIAVIILRDGQVVQSVQFQHTNVIHYDAIHAIETFNRWSVDEIVFLDVSRNDQGRAQFRSIVERVSETCFVPLSVGGWICDEDYARALLNSGADKLVVNTILHSNPKLVTSLADRFGKQCIVASIDFTRASGQARVAVDRGRQVLPSTPVDWAIKAQALGAGEIFLNCIEHDGKRQGYETETLKAVCEAVEIPVIAFGGVFRWKHLFKGVEAGADAVAAANIFHYTEHSTKHAKRYLAGEGVRVRKEGLI
ncbi:MAG: imidazole glycerol phosphate synthase subunit HisF [Oleiphilus sp.]|nr:MAG: imidazole glycerol phosphate synthase subunit HisF [Oleiphilus sp.]